jgi:hypothetical protein
VRLVVVLLLVLAGAPRADAQTAGAATGNIDGTVRDPTGAVLPGVTVVVFGDALMGRKTSTSGADGGYRVIGVPPGTYTLEFSRRGFRSGTLNHIAVAIGATQTVNVTLEVAIVESVVVEAEVWAVDRHGTTWTTSFTARELAELPGSRNPSAILWATPSVMFARVDVGGNIPDSQFSAYGTTGLTAPTIEGINVTGMNQFGFPLDYGAFAEVAAGAGAYGPEWMTPGVHLQFLTKSGGNAHHGTVVAAYEHRSWQSHNIDASQIALGAAGNQAVKPREANRLWHYHDVNADAGGFIKPDRVWWYASARHQGRSARQVLFPAEPLESTSSSATAKGTLRLTDRQRVVIYGQRGINREPIRLAGYLFPATTINTSRESTASQLVNGLVWKGEWNTVIRNHMFAEVRVGQFIVGRAERPNGTSPRFEDRSLSEASGGHRDWQEDRRNDQVNGALTFVTDGKLGRHHLTVGGDVQRMIDGQRWNRSFPGDVLHELRGGSPFQVYLFQAPSHSTSGIWLYEAYASDSWQVNRRLTLNLGIRFDRFRTFLPAQEHPAGRFNPSPRSYPAVDRLLAWNFAASRVGASVDLGGGGRTIVKLNYGRYWLPPSTVLGFNLNPNQPAWWERWTWSDTNDTGVWEPGEQSALQESRGGTAALAVDPALRPPYVREMAAHVEREVAGGLSVSSGVVWRGERQQGFRQTTSWPFEAFVPAAMPLRDPGPDAVAGTDDDGPDIPVSELREALLGQSEIIVRNVPYGDSDYFTLEFVARRRLRGRWSLLTSFSTTWNRDHASAYIGQTVRANEFPVTPNDFIQTDEQGRHRFHVWSARVLATYDGPWGIRVAPLLRHQSGQPFGRTLSARLNYGEVRVLAEPVGSRRQDHITVLDLKVERDVLVRRRGRVTAYLEVFNALNANPAEQISWLTNTFLRPLAIVPPRIARAGLKIDW